MAEQHTPRSVAHAAALRRMARLLRLDPEIRAASVSTAQLEALRASGDSAIERIAAACEVFSARPCLGVRLQNGGGDPFAAVSYGELWSRAAAAAAGLRHAGIAAPGTLIGIYGSTTVDWIVVDLACLYLGAVSVPLQRALSRDDLLHIAREAELGCVVATESCMETATWVAGNCPSVRHVVSMDGAAPSGGGRVGVHALAELERRGAEQAIAPTLPDRSDRLFSIVYTSGSTGRPKGVMITERRWAETLRDAVSDKPLPTITVGYLPLSHMAGRIGVYTTMMVGGRSNLVAEDDMALLFDSIRSTRPTSMTLVPRVSGVLHQQFLELSLQASAEPARGYADGSIAPILERIRDERLGGRLCFAATGAAPTAPEVAEFLSDGLGIHLVDAYGSTEVARIAVNGVVQPGIEYRLIDLPELGYTTKDLPYPRGELAVKSPRQTPGYFRNPAANSELFDEAGFMRTGDIVEERAPRQIAWIDRKNDVIRLAHGEYVNLSRLESLFATQSPYIEQAFVFGESSRDFPLAVIVPRRSTVDAHADVATSAPARRDAAIKALLSAEVARVASDNRLRGAEVPRDFLVSLEPFTRSNGLLSDAGKHRRPILKERYGARLRELYAELAARQVRGRREAQLPADAPLDDRVRSAVAAALGHAELGRDALRSSFVQLGGDSLSAVPLRDALCTIAGVRVDVAEILDPTTSLAELVERRGRAAGRDARASFEAIHNRDSRWARARELELSRFLPEALLAGASRLPLAARPSHYLVTGATGFLGNVLLAELLSRLDPATARVTCIVRARDDAAARERVARRVSLVGSTSLARFAEWSAASRLRVLAGDLAAPALGLPEAVHAELTEGVDAVVHSGALVNHVLAYTHLFAPNVVATAEIMRFAVTRQRKRVHFVSTSGVVAGARSGAPVLETDRAAALWPGRPLSSRSGADYALGYRTSKWASEVMLCELHDRCGVPVDISRCSMVLPHRTAAVFNAGDAFARLLYSLVKTGVAPRSFYADDYRGDRHYDGLPVDLVARAIVETCLDPDAAQRTYHVCNPGSHGGASLDTFVDWIESSGHRVERLEHAHWHGELVRRLAHLPPEERQRSAEAIAFRWQQPIGDGNGSTKLDTTAFRTTLARLGIAEAPSLDEAYVHRCLRLICGDAQ